MNQIKTTQKIPEILKYCNITSIYKNKGSRKDFSNYRGIFRVTVFRSILDKLIYNDEYPQIDENITDSNVGARKGRNIRDNIFVTNAIMNSISKRRLKDIDIGIYDVEKCFDKLWAQECFNDMSECGFKNDKLSLLYEENINAKVAVKTQSGNTKRVTMSEIIMQGTVWGSLFCTVSIDKLGKESYTKPDMLYKYNGVPIPPLGMVDDILTVSNVENTLEMNKMVNTFIESKKLRLSHKKCVQIHVGRGHANCPALNVHENPMNETDSEKYLGDIMSKNGTILPTIEKRKSKGDGIVAEILSIINEIPLGKHRVDVALRLREAMLINGILFNSEAWHGVTLAHIAKLESVDEALIRGILKAHSKTPKEFLYLETGAMPLRWIISQRRINYMNHILQRDDNELVKKVWLAQKNNPVQGDFVKLVQKDLKDLGLTQEQVTSNMTKLALKSHARNVAFNQLKDIQSKHTKVNHINYSIFQTQPYLQSEIITQTEAETLTALRSQCLRGIKHNFPKMFDRSLCCPLKCFPAGSELEDTQPHILQCKVLQLENQVNIFDMNSDDIEKQAKVAKIVIQLMKKRERLLEDQELQLQPTRGIVPGPVLPTTLGVATIHV